MAILTASQSTVGSPIPEGYHSVTPWIVAKGAAELIDYLKEAFDAEEISRMTHPDGKIGHAEIKIGDSIIMLFDSQDNWPSTPGFFRLFVEDGDAVYHKAIAAGGKAVTEMTDLAFGDRVGRVSDPAGNIWWIQTPIEELDPEEIVKRGEDPVYVDAMRKVEESLGREMSGRR